MTGSELPTRRVVLLGASNVTRSIATVVDTACRAWGRPLDLLAAIGHGRSYGLRSRVLVRSLPGILECGLWPALAARPPAPTAALITDIGNDLFYGASPQMIAGWVDECCRRLSAIGGRLVMTRLPVCNVGRVKAWQFAMFRTMSYPGCHATLAEITRGAQELDDRLTEVAGRYDCRLIEPEPHWYGLDPVHIRPFQSRRAWQAILGGWNEILPEDAASGSLRRWIYLNARIPERRWLLGRQQGRPQPSGRLPDGTLVSLF
ncbi:MAG TPA: hypothetical protein PK867_04560 [Pirellulales bacterium]|nr:hypothetical protein [Pirellulales bacterium]